MAKKYLKLFTIPGLLIFDTFSIFISAYLGLLIFFSGKIPETYSVDMFPYMAICSLMMIIFGTLAGCYYNIWTRVSAGEAFKQILAVMLVYFSFLMTYSLHEIKMPIGVVFLSAFCTLFLTVGIRLLTRFINWITVHLKWTQNSGKCRVIIIGAGETGISLARNLINKPENGRIPIGFIDNNHKLWNNWILGRPVFGGFEMLKSILIRCNIDEVIITAKHIDKESLIDIFEKCKTAKCKLKKYDVSNPIDDNQINKINIREVGVEELLCRDPVETNMAEVKNFISDKIVLVTGGAGSIGSEICRQVLALGCKKLVIFDFHENGLFDINIELSSEYPPNKYELVLGSIRDINRLDNVFSQYKPNVIFHAAAHKHVPMMELNPYEAIKNNIIGTINVARKADEYGVDKFILISSDKAVNPPNIMGASKRVAELVIHLFDIKSKTEYAAVRFGNVLGSNGSVIPLFKNQISRGGPVTVTHPDIERFFMTIPEAVQLVFQAGAIAKGGEVFVLDMGYPVKIYDLAVLLIQLSGLEPGEDINIVFTGLRPGEKLYEEIALSDEELNKTTHRKITVVKNGKYNYVKLLYQISQIEKFVSKNHQEMVFKLIHELVPSYEITESTDPYKNDVDAFSENRSGLAKNTL